LALPVLTLTGIGRLRLDVGERPRRHGHIGGPARPDEPQLRGRQAYPESRRGPVQEPAAPVHLREQSAAARHHLRRRRYPDRHDLRSRLLEAFSFRPKAPVRPGNFVAIPNQAVDIHGNISVPYAGSIRARGRTQVEVQEAIVTALKNRAIEPQVIVSMVEQKTSMISVLGEGRAARIPATAAPERMLDVISRAGLVAVGGSTGACRRGNLGAPGAKRQARHRALLAR
jgi:protein involved in polysaccharide export with SLBB domain